MGQASFAELEHDLKTRRTRRAAFLEKMDGLIPRGRLEEPDPGDRLFGEIDAPLATPGHRLKTGTIVDASIVAAPSSTKNRKRAENREAAVNWQVAMKPGKRRQWDKAGPEEAAERRKGPVRAKVEHPFLYVKRRFGYAKVRYRGLAKNRQRIAVLLGLSNPLIAWRCAAA